MTEQVRKHIMYASTSLVISGGDMASTWVTKLGEHAVGVMTTLTLVTKNSRKRRLLRSRRLITG